MGGIGGSSKLSSAAGGEEGLQFTDEEDEALRAHLDTLGIKIEDLNGLLSPVSDTLKFFDGSIAGGPLGPLFVDADLSDDAIKRLYNLGRAALGI